MLASAKELLDKIRLGEDSTLELKEARFAGDHIQAPSQESLADELAAFANGRGGVLVLGVTDAREIVGIPIERLDAVEDLVRRACNDSIRPSLAPYIERLTLPAATGEAAILKVEVDRSLFVHQSPGGYFHRVGSSKRSMPPEYLARLFQQRSQTRLIRFDEQTVPGATLDDLDPDLWERFRTELSEDDRETFLHKLAVARQDEDGTWRPTVSGVLMATREPRRWMPNAFIQAVAYRGTEARPQEKGGFYQLDAADLSGPLDMQVFEACRFVYRNMRVEATKTLGRRDYPQYHLGAVFEAIVNAVAHRDYAIYGSKVRLRLFADRLELYSPGALANTLDLDALPYRQSARNEALTSLLAKCSVPKDMEWLQTRRRTLMDRRGEGVGLILRESENLSGRRPRYDLYGESELVLTIFAASAASEDSTESSP
jgi:predicted HTH transcriptional regulator